MSDLDCEREDRATHNSLPDKSYPIKSSAFGKRKHVDFNAEFGTESDQETDNFF